MNLGFKSSAQRERANLTQKSWTAGALVCDAEHCAAGHLQSTKKSLPLDLSFRAEAQNN
jgi:hypothetical protein